VVLESGTKIREAAVSKNKSLATAVLVIGLLVLLASALADIVGVGATPLVFGYKQLAGSAAGAILVIIGALLYWRASRGS
jgi:hypothetical protein